MYVHLRHRVGHFGGQVTVCGGIAYRSQLRIFHLLNRQPAQNFVNHGRSVQLFSVHWRGFYRCLFSTCGVSDEAGNPAAYVFYEAALVSLFTLVTYVFRGSTGNEGGVVPQVQLVGCQLGNVAILDNFKLCSEVLKIAVGTEYLLDGDSLCLLRLNQNGGARGVTGHLPHHRKGGEHAYHQAQPQDARPALAHNAPVVLQVDRFALGLVEAGGQVMCLHHVAWRLIKHSELEEALFDVNDITGANT